MAFWPGAADIGVVVVRERAGIPQEFCQPNKTKHPEVVHHSKPCELATVATLPGPRCWLDPNAATSREALQTPDAVAAA